MEASALYDMASIQSSYMLPYLALASAKEGSDVSDVTAILARFPPNEPGFDYQLTSAVLAGIRGQTGESLASLKLARYRRPRNDDERPTLPQYTYGDICEILYDLTKDSKFRDEAWTGLAVENGRSLGTHGAMRSTRLWRFFSLVRNR